MKFKLISSIYQNQSQPDQFNKTDLVKENIDNEYDNFEGTTPYKNCKTEGYSRGTKTFNSRINLKRRKFRRRQLNMNSSTRKSITPLRIHLESTHDRISRSMSLLKKQKRVYELNQIHQENVNLLERLQNASSSIKKLK